MNATAQTECGLHSSFAVTAGRRRSIAILPFGFAIEDYLDRIRVSLESYCTELTGGWMFGYVEALQRAGFDTVLVVVSDRIGNPTQFVHEPSGSRVHVLPVPGLYRRLRRGMVNTYARNVSDAFGGRTGPLRWLRKEAMPYAATPVRLLAGVLRAERCAAVMCQEYEFSRFDLCVAVGAKLGIPVFATFQGGDYHRGRMERWIRPWSMARARGFVVGPRRESLRLQSRYGVDKAKIARIFNPLDLATWFPEAKATCRQMNGWSPESRVMIWHGRISIRQKGLDLLLEAWERIQSDSRGNGWRLLLIGDGQDSVEFRARLAAKAWPNVEWIDEYILDRSRMRSYLSAADLFVFPSRHEGFPVAPIEAMACGLPVVAANANGIEDIFEGGERDGGVVTPLEDPVALAESILSLMTDQSRRDRLSRAARARAVSAFGMDAVSGQFRDFLAACAGGGQDHQ